MKRIALIGGNSQIARSIIPYLKKNYILDIYSTKKNKLDKNIFSLQKFPQNNNISAVLNFAGPGDPAKHKKLKIFKIFDRLDNMVLNFIKKNQTVKYINISTGIVLNLEKLSNTLRNNYDYVNTKFYLEQKHRRLKNLKIYDLRIFGFFSRYIPLNSGFFLSQIIRSIKKKKVFKVDSFNNVRDYIGGVDLYFFIKKIISQNLPNRSFNLMSRKSVKKFDILNIFSKNYGLKFIIDKNVSINNKNNIYLVHKKLVKSNYFKPKLTSLELIKKESKFLFRKNDE